MTTARTLDPAGTRVMNLYTRSLNDTFKGMRSLASSLGVSSRTPKASPATINLNDLPSKPKRPAGAWNRFVIQEKNTLQGSKLVESMKILAAKWKSMSVSERAPFEAASNEENAIYKEQMKEYNKIMKQTIPLVDAVRAMNLDRRTRVKTKRPKSGWNLFVKEVMAKDRPVLSNGKTDLASLGARWNSLTESQRQAYNERARQEA